MTKVIEKLNFTWNYDLIGKSKQEAIAYLENIPGDYYLRWHKYNAYIENEREEKPFERERRVKLEKLEAEAKDARDKQDKLDTIKNLKDTLEKLEADFY